MFFYSLKNKYTGLKRYFFFFQKLVTIEIHNKVYKMKTLYFNIIYGGFKPLELIQTIEIEC